MTQKDQAIHDLKKELSRIKRLYEKSLFYLSTDPEVALSQARKSAEAICKSIYIKAGLEKNSKPAKKMMLDELIRALKNHELIPGAIEVHLSTIHRFGNFGSHDQGLEDEFIDEAYVEPCMRSLGMVFNWYMANHQEDDDTIDDVAASLKTKTAPKETLKVIGNHAPPVRIFEETEATGFYFDLCRAIGKEQGLKFSFEKASNHKAFTLLQQGKADLMLGPNKTKAREEKFIYSKHPLPAATKSLFVNVMGEPILAYEDLYDKYLIVMKNTNYNKRIHDDENIVKVEVSDYKTGIKMVESNPKYVLIMPTLQGDYLCDLLEIDLIKSPLTIEGSLSYFIYGKHLEKSTIDKVEKGLASIMNSDLYERILAMYKR